MQQEFQQEAAMKIYLKYQQLARRLYFHSAFHFQKAHHINFKLHLLLLILNFQKWKFGGSARNNKPGRRQTCIFSGRPHSLQSV